MDNLAPAQLSANEIPDGFTSASAQQGPAGGGGNNNAAAMKRLQMDEQRKAILEQALSQEALARLANMKESDFRVAIGISETGGEEAG